MTTVDAIIKSIGRKQLAAALGVTTKAVAAAKHKGEFPAAWFLVVNELIGPEPAPMALFNWRRAVPAASGILDGQKKAAQ